MRRRQLVAEAIRIVEHALSAMGLRLDEKTGEYYYEETLLKRVLEGSSQSGSCETCDDNVDAGWIDSEDSYPSGDDGPPFHPNCTCEEEYKTSRERVYV